MELWPAIDILAGRAVRLLRGDFAAETSYGEPVSVAAAYVAAGARRLHVVDLDGALHGQGVNREVVAAVTASVGPGVAVQVGGGIRYAHDVDEVLGFGARRVVLGTTAVEEPDLLADLADRWPGRILAGLDYRRTAEGAEELAVRGWRESSEHRLVDVLAELEASGIAGVVVTDISRDGTGSGPDFAGLTRFLGSTELPILASGGVSGPADLAALARTRSGDRRLAGAIVGKALLSGAMTIAEAEGACETSS